MPALKENILPKTPGTKRKIITRILLTVIFIILFIGFIWSYTRYRTLQKQVVLYSDPQYQEQLAQQEVDEVLSRVQRHIILSETDSPSVATIVDAKALAEQQPFFKLAKNGDKLILYPKRAIIYNPTEDILVNVGSVVVAPQGAQAPSGDSQAQNQNSKPQSQIEQQREGSRTQETPVSLDIRNGSAIAQKASQVARQMGTESAYSVYSVGDAARADYADTIIVNLTGKDVSALEKRFGVLAIQALPEGEVASLADVIIIVGRK